jgi:hypothetical protein
MEMDVAAAETQLMIIEENSVTERQYNVWLASHPNGSMAEFWEHWQTLQ